MTRSSGSQQAQEPQVSCTSTGNLITDHDRRLDALMEAGSTQFSPNIPSRVHPVFIASPHPFPRFLLPTSLQTVAGVPRLFVGQVPTSTREQDLLPLFAKHGEVESIMVVRGPDQKSRGCAMVQFRRWAAAEAAAEALHGTAPLDGAKGRHIVINFARPRKGSATTPAEPAIIPRRLFIGQVSVLKGVKKYLRQIST
jgi:hypothetical protein